MSSETTVLITGANRGLGRGLLERYLLLSHHTVIAFNRDPSHPSSQSLSNLPKAEGTSLIVLKTDASIDTDAFDAVKELQEKHGIEHLDIVIANAGVSYAWPSVADMKIEDLTGHMKPNVHGMVTLYQATRELLRKSKREGGPIFTPVGSSAGYIANQLPISNAVYGPSKAVVNWLTVRINAEDEWLNAFVLGPGFAQTDLGNTGAQALGYEQAFVTVEDSCDGMMKMLKESTKEKHGGKMVTYEGVLESGW